MNRPSKELMAEWEEKLAKSGFKDAECVDDKEKLNRWDSFYFGARYNELTYNAKDAYFNWAYNVLQTYDFKTIQDKAMWYLHSEGYSLSEIAGAIGSKKNRVYTGINKIKEEAKIEQSNVKNGKK